MALTPRSAAVFLLDCNASMNRLHSVRDGLGEHASSRSRPAFQVAQEYIKAKIVQRMIRDLKTLPCAVLAFGHPKTKNILTTRLKETAREAGEPFVRENDLYRGIYELIPFEFAPDTSTLQRIDQAAAGQGHNVDIHSAIIAGLETLDAQPAVAKYPTKEIFVLTDGETESDWDGWKGTAARMNERGVSLKVIGVSIDDEYMDFAEKDKSDVKRENEQHFHQIVRKLNKAQGPGTSLVANASRAIAATAAPKPKSTNSRADSMSLKLGDSDSHPDSSLVIRIDVKKAVVPASIPSMKKMSLAGFERIQQSQQTSQPAEPPARGQKRGFEDMLDSDSEKPFDVKPRNGNLNKIGTTFDNTLRSAGLQESKDDDADLASHAVTTERRYFYRPVNKPQDLSGEIKVKPKPILGGASDEEMDADGPEEDRKEIGDDATLVDAYHYGGDLVNMGDYDDDFGKLGGLTTGMEVISFMKVSDLRYDWRMGDVFYVYASSGQSGSERLFSAFVNAMEERRSCAIVRFVKKGFRSSKTGNQVMPDPQVGILFPATDPEAKSEFCYYIRLPFGEDIRSPGFPSLANLFNSKGMRIDAHPLLPTKSQEQAMDDFVDAMSLGKLTEVDENGVANPWFNIFESFSPAIHNIQNTLMFRLSNPDGDLPPIHESLLRYMDPPQELVESALEAKTVAIAALKVLVAPPKPKKVTKANENFVQPDEENAARAHENLFGIKAPAEKANASKAPRVSQVKVSATGIEVKDSQESQAQQIAAPVAAVPAPAKDEDGPKDKDEEPEEELEEEPVTEDEDEAEDASFATTPATSVSLNAQHTGTSIAELVENARRLVDTSFSSQNFAKASSELQKARQEAKESSNAPAYNIALRAFVAYLASHKHRDYLARIEREGLGLLVGGGTTEADAENFLQALI
ncbi:uncharacterized protein JCM15063_005337 [Sporobolomyces koalae]|uniref:uncharacterized protein n=1 Tax=Sporobolomyces koalae TaxID=500713 RepID=UPI003182800B